MFFRRYMTYQTTDENELLGLEMYFESYSTFI